MVWSVDFEDTTGACGEKWPVLSAIKEVLIGIYLATISSQISILDNK